MVASGHLTLNAIIAAGDEDSAGDENSVNLVEHVDDSSEADEPEDHEEAGEDDDEEDGEEDEEEVYEVEKIVDYRLHNCVDSLEKFWRTTRKRRPPGTLSHTGQKPTLNDETRTRSRSHARQRENADVPFDNWDSLVEVESVEAATSSTEVRFRLRWKDGRRTEHTANTVYSKCPQQAIRFFAQHLGAYD
ncbi:hypothetical protein BC832DRAFT_46690 [Gaertneriomyces semiglobifer]|nr:hypothetical protein BC832DRAFT_46690 [Gaertneriomyces semiglobifer]